MRTLQQTHSCLPPAGRASGFFRRFKLLPNHANYRPLGQKVLYFIARSMAYGLVTATRKWSLRHVGDQKVAIRYVSNALSLSQVDVTRALNAARAAGYNAARILIGTDGRIEIVTTMEGEATAAMPAEAERRSDGWSRNMPRRGSSITQADVARIIRAARQEGVASVEFKLCGEETTIVLRLVEFPPKRLAEVEDLNL